MPSTPAAPERVPTSRSYDSQRIATEGKIRDDIEQRFPGLHPDMVRAVASDSIEGDNMDLAVARDKALSWIREILELCRVLDDRVVEELASGDSYGGAFLQLPDVESGVTIPGGKVQPAVYAAMKQHKSLTDLAAKPSACLRTLRLMGLINVIIEEVKLLLIDKYPRVLKFQSKQMEDIPETEVSNYKDMLDRSCSSERDRAGTEGSTGLRASTVQVDYVEMQSQKFMPESVVGLVEYDFERHTGLDNEGRPIYRNTKGINQDISFLAWHRGKFGGHWSMHTDMEGLGHGSQAKWAPLPFDPGGHWTTAPEADIEAAESAPPPLRSNIINDHGTDFDTIPMEEMESDKFNEKWHAEALLTGRAATPTVRKLLESKVIWKVQRSTKPEQVWESVMVYPELEELVEMGTSCFQRWRPDMRARAIRLMKALLDTIRFFRGAEDRADESPVKNIPSEDQVAAIRQLLHQLATEAENINNDSWEKTLAKELPGFPFELSWVQLMILNCRLFGLSRIRNPKYPMALVRIHDFVFRAWQRPKLKEDSDGAVVTAVRYLDLESQTLETLPEPPACPPGHLRFVAVSDTHGWSVAMPMGDGKNGAEDLSFGRIILPEGDVLLHCGDLLNEGEVLQFSDDVHHSTKLIEELRALEAVSARRDKRGGQHEDKDGEPRKFKWVFLIGGNHDAPVFTLAAVGKLTEMIGDSVVLLQSTAEFDCTNPLDRDAPTVINSVAKRASVRANIVNGAVRIMPDCSLSPPHLNTSSGVVLVGSGLSLANNPWTANRAFQIQKHEPQKLRDAAEHLMMFRPDIVMTHGPPAGYGDEGKGDQQLRDVVDAPGSSVKLHLFGHAHSNGFAGDKRPWEMHGRKFPGRCFINCAMVSSMYMPTRLPIVFDWPVEQGGWQHALHAVSSLRPLVSARIQPKSCTSCGIL